GNRERFVLPEEPQADTNIVPHQGGRRVRQKRSSVWHRVWRRRCTALGHFATETHPAPSDAKHPAQSNAKHAAASARKHPTASAQSTLPRQMRSTLQRQT